MFSSVGIDLTERVYRGSLYKTGRRIDNIVVHCSFSPQGRGDDAHTIDRWHIERWGTGIGYHYVVLEDGTIQKGRWVDYPGAHVKGHNSYTIGVCRIGGMDEFGNEIEDCTPDQDRSIVVLSSLLINMYNLRVDDVLGHYEFPEVHKSCPLCDMGWIRSEIENFDVEDMIHSGKV